MKYTYPPHCKTDEERRQYRIEARKKKKHYLKEQAKKAPRSKPNTKGSGWQRGYEINQYYGNTKTKKK